MLPVPPGAACRWSDSSVVFPVMIFFIYIGQLYFGYRVYYLRILPGVFCCASYTFLWSDVCQLNGYEASLYCWRVVTLFYWFPHFLVVSAVRLHIFVSGPFGGGYAAGLSWWVWASQFRKSSLSSMTPSTSWMLPASSLTERTMSWLRAILEALANVGLKNSVIFLCFCYSSTSAWLASSVLRARGSLGRGGPGTCRDWATGGVSCGAICLAA